MVVAFRRHTLLPLDDCLYALQPAIPHLTRSALHPSDAEETPLSRRRAPILGEPPRGWLSPVYYESLLHIAWNARPREYFPSLLLAICDR